MPYSKTSWQDRQVPKPLTFSYPLVDNGDGTTTLVPVEGTPTQAGTPINASNLNKLETQYDQAYADAKSYVAPLFSQSVYTGAKGSFSGYSLTSCQLAFYTNGASATATANFTFSNAYKSTPVIFPANIQTNQSWGDYIIYPYIYNITTTGFSVRIQTYNGSYLGGSTAANLFMLFMVFGQL